MALAIGAVMRRIMEHLLAIQSQQLNGGWQSGDLLWELAKHRAEVPPPVYAHFERILARGKKGVAIVLDGVCSECHLQINRGKLASLAADLDICLCDNCGRYLYLPILDLEKAGSNANGISQSAQRKPRSEVQKPA